MLNGAMPSAFAMAGTAVFRIVVSSDCMKKATATSHGKKRFTASIEIAEGTGRGIRCHHCRLRFFCHAQKLTQPPGQFNALTFCQSGNRTRRAAVSRYLPPCPMPTFLHITIGCRSSCGRNSPTCGLAMTGLRSWKIPTGNRWKKSRNSRSCFNSPAFAPVKGTTGRKGKPSVRPHRNQIHQSPWSLKLPHLRQAREPPEHRFTPPKLPLLSDSQVSSLRRIVWCDQSAVGFSAKHAANPTPLSSHTRWRTTDRLISAATPFIHPRRRSADGSL